MRLGIPRRFALHLLPFTLFQVAAFAAVSVSVSPTTTSLPAAGTQQFTATVLNTSNTSVTWQVNGTTGGNSNNGTISTSGLYLAPAKVSKLRVITVKAISKADTTKSASAKVTLTVSPVSVTISPPSASLAAGKTQKFTATVLNSSNTSVTWQVNGITAGNSTVGTISSTGTYKAPSKIPSQTVVTVTAVSAADVTKSASAPVSLNPVVITIDPTSAILSAGGQQPFTATVQNASSNSVTWLVNGVSGGNSTVGTVSSSGLYRAPATVAAQITVTVTARSQSDTTKTASASVVVNPPVASVSVSLNLTSVSLGAGGSQSFTATVHDASNPAVTWYVNNSLTGDSTIGTIVDGGSGSALYTAPASIATQIVVTVKAVSQEDSTKSASASVTLRPVSITINPPSASLGAGGSQPFTAQLQNASDPTVVWSVADSLGGTDPALVGSISNTGGYAAPAVITSQTSVTVKAGSQQDPTKFATAQVSLNPLTITVSPGTATVGAKGTQPFSANVLYTANTAVTWDVDGTLGGDINSVGSISPSGLYTAPDTVSSPTQHTIRATSQADGNKSATADITLSPVVVAVSPKTATVAITKTTQLTANVQYSDNPGVNWKVNGVDGGDDTNGHISAAGLYTAPATVPSPATFSVTAISQADPNQSDSADVTISAATGNSFYVATTGSDSAAGTFAAPWKTIAHAAAASSGVKAGDSVYVRGGIYKESVVFAISGSAAGGPITFQSYPGESAIIDGTGIAALSNPHGLIHIDSRSYLTISGFEIRNYQTSSSSLIPAGIWITGTAGNIQILNNSVHDIKTSSEANGQAYGISVYGTASTPIDTVTIDGNQVFNLKTGGSESVNVDGNVTNFTITHNTVHDNDNIAIDAIGYEGVSSNAALDFARNGVISDNIIYNISGINNAGEGNDYDANGVYVDGGSQILIERNLIHNVDIGIEAAAEHKGKTSSFVTIRNNIIYASNSIGISIGGYDSNRGGTDHCTIVNNTLYGNDTHNTGSGEFQIQYYATNNVFKNNIVYATSQALLVDSYTSSSANPVDIDYNLYFSPASSGKFVWGGTTRTGLSAFQSATGKDTHSQYLNPLFVNLGIFDLHVQPPSPAVDSGIDLTPNVNGATDLAGNPRIQGTNIDKGAYEQ